MLNSGNKNVKSMRLSVMEKLRSMLLCCSKQTALWKKIQQLGAGI